MLIIFFLLSYLSSAYQEANATSSKEILNPITTSDSLYSSIHFSTKLIEHHNFCEGEINDYAYSFKNIGQVPLVISSVRSGCGCYVPQWPKESILPGDSGVIIGRYSSRGRPGKFQRSLTVIFHKDRVPKQMLHVRGYAVPKDICETRK